MTKLNVYSANGMKKGSASLPASLVEKENLVLLAQAIRVYEDNRHLGLSKTKTRGEVSASTRKIYRQKGTGLARHGAISAPIFVGGGIVHGPRGLKRKLMLPSKMRSKALKVALTLAAKEGKLILVDGISKLNKTKEVSSLLQKIVEKENMDKKSRFTVVLSEKNNKLKKVIKNLKVAEAAMYRTLNAHTVYFGGVIVVDKDSFTEKTSFESKETVGKTSSPAKTSSKQTAALKKDTKIKSSVRQSGRGKNK